MLEYNEIYNSIIKEFEICISISEEIKKEVEALAKSRIDICKILKIRNVEAETLDLNEKEIVRDININESNIKNYEKKQIQLIYKINVRKQEIKVIKLHINKLANNLWQEQQESKKFRKDLHIFVSREKFKILKKLFDPKYKKVFAKYSNELSIKTEIKECNERKQKIRKETQNFNNSIKKNNRKITIDKIALAEMRKSIINMRKRIELFSIKIQKLKNYKEMEEKFRIEVLQYEK